MGRIQQVLEVYQQIVGAKVATIYLRMCLMAGDANAIRISLKRLAEDMGVDPKNLRMYLRRMEEAGMVKIIANTTESGKNDANTYQLLI